MERICPTCLKPVTNPDPRKKFCSRPCFYKSRTGVPRMDLRKRVTKECAACGASFESGGRARHRGAVSFCSRRCAANARWRTGSTSNALSAVDAAYLAGLMDGEGSVMLYRRKKDAAGSALRIAIANTNMILIDWCLSKTGVGNVLTKLGANERHKTGYQWIANAQAAASVLVQIRPYLTIKAAQADLGIEFQRKMKIPADKVQKEWQQQWRERMCAMNARGPARTPPT